MHRRAPIPEHVEKMPVGTHKKGRQTTSGTIILQAFVPPGLHWEALLKDY